MIPQNRSEFVDLCLRALGHPVIDINVETTQLDDRVDEALQMFEKYHYDAVEHNFTLYQIQQADIDNGYIAIPEDVVGIIGVQYQNVNSSADWTTNIGQLYRDIAYDLSFRSTNYVNLSEYAVYTSYAELINMMLGSAMRFSFSQHTNRLQVHTDWNKNFDVDQYLLLEQFNIIDPDLFPNVWNDEWLKAYATALIGRQWGNNLSKFNEVQLPGGITLNGEAIYDKHNTAITELKEELELKYTLPIDFMVG